MLQTPLNLFSSEVQLEDNLLISASLALQRVLAPILSFANNLLPVQAPFTLRIIQQAQHTHIHTPYQSQSKIQLGFCCCPPKELKRTQAISGRTRPGPATPSKTIQLVRFKQKMAVTQTWLTAALSYLTVSFLTQRPPDKLQF